MRDNQIVVGFATHDQAIGRLNNELREMREVLGKAYHYSLTHVMMWDVLLGLLNEKGMVTKVQFETALKELTDKTRAAMDAEAKAKAPETTITVESDVPAIPVVH